MELGDLELSTGHNFKLVRLMEKANNTKNLNYFTLDIFYSKVFCVSTTVSELYAKVGK